MRKKLKKRQKKQLALLTAVVLIASVIAIILLTPVFDVTEIEVNGNIVLKQEEIIVCSGIETGVNTFSVNLGKAEDNIKNSEEYIKSVKIKRVLPSKIVISVEEEVGVAYLNAEEGFVIITAEGRCVEVTDGVDSSEKGVKVITPPDLPQIVGMDNVKYKVGSKVTAENERQLNALLMCLKEFTKHGYVFDMKEIDVTDTSKIKFYYGSRNLRVTVGKTENLDYKMECFKKIYEVVVEKTKEGEMPSGYIDLERNVYGPKETPEEGLDAPSDTDSDTNSENTQ